MAHSDFAISDSELESLARLAGRDVGEVRAELRRRPWSLHDLLADPALVEAVLEPASILVTPGPFALFAVLVRQAADDVLDREYVNDWVGPRSRLPVFDVEPLQELVIAPGRLLFIARLLTSMVAPTPVSPVPTTDPWELLDWVNAVDEDDRAVVFRRMGDLSLFLAGVQADAHGATPLTEDQAKKVARLLDAGVDEILELADPRSVSPGLDALEELGARSYQQARRVEPNAPPVIGDIAQRIRPARRFLTHLADRFLSPHEQTWGLAA